MLQLIECLFQSQSDFVTAGGLTDKRESFNYSNGSDYNLGQDIDDGISIMMGATEMTFGSGAAGSGAVVTVGTGGVGGVVGVPVAAIGVAVTTHGAAMSGSATNSLINQKGRVDEASGNGTQEKRVFEPNPKHGKSNRGRASKEPTDPQKSLDKSIELKGETERRVSTNKSANEFSVFDKHEGNKFHGHVREWNGLNQQMKNVLLENNLVNRKGKIQK